MADRSLIAWTDATWNVVTGCTKVSNGCLHCYIERTPPFRIGHRRFDRPGIGGTTGVLLHRERLERPYRWRKPRRVFVCSLADLFHDDVPDDVIIDVWSVMATNPRHTFQVLTKRPARMRALLSRPGFREAVARCGAARMEDGDNWFDYLMFEPKAWPLPHVWGGVSAEDQPNADRRIPILLDTPDLAVRWVSMEPMLGPIDLSRWLCRQPGVPGHTCTASRHALSWVVVGGESGPGARPMDLVAAARVVEQSRTAGVPVFMKQLGTVVGGRDHHDLATFPEVLRVREYPVAREAVSAR